ncbi:response regulator transcription factor [Amnibacterium setariae]|uniref:response regulator transcription factor n=1 Tax=Amnibacterium setariae TaxID=2306585 RepID=UPI001F1D6CED|nr:response regulator transcription factor [Amnibacterium setariae]
MADVLVVEDDPRMRTLLAQSLEGEGHRVETAADGLAGLIALRGRAFDAAAIDIGLPGMSGVELCRHARREGLLVPIVLVTARDGVADRVLGLDSGADDYLVKPFALEELAARLRALLRRSASAGGRVEVGDLVLDPPAVRATVLGRTVPLSVKEFGVLRALAARAGDAVDRRTLLTEVWGDPDRFDGAIVDQYVSYVRKKLAAAGAGPMVETVRGVGYRLVAPA